MIKLTRRLLVIVAVFVSLSMTAAWAYWATNGFGFGIGLVGTLAAPTGVGSSYSPTTGAITVSWTGVTPPDGDASHVGYYVERGSINVCGSPGSPLPSTAVSCADTDVPRGSHTHTVTAVFRSWTSSSSSNAVGVTPSVAIAAGQSVPVGGTISATLHGFDGSDTITFKLDNASGTPITTPASVSTPAGSGSATATLTIPSGATTGSHTIYAAGLGGGADSATSANTFTVTSASASRLVFTTVPSGNQTASATATIGAYQVQQQDSSGNPVTAESAVTVNLTSDSTGTKFFSITSGGAGTSSVTSVNIPAGSSTTGNFFYSDTKAGSPTLTAQAAGVANAGTTATVTIVPGTAARLAWTNVTVTQGTVSTPCLLTCSVVGLGNNNNFTANVSVTDTFGNTVSNLGAGHTVTVSTPSSGSGSGGAFTAPAAGTSVTLTIGDTGAAQSTQAFTFRTQNGNWTTDTFTAATLAGTVYTSSTASVTKN